MSPCFYSIFPFTCFSAGALDHRLGNHSALNSRPIFSLFPGETCWIYKSLLTQEPGKRPSYSLFSNPPQYSIFAPPPPPPTFAKTIVFKCSWEYCIFPRAMEDNNLRKIWGANRMYYGGFENRSEGSWLNKMWQLIFSFNQTKLAVLNRYSGGNSYPLCYDELFWREKSTFATIIFRSLYRLYELFTRSYFPRLLILDLEHPCTANWDWSLQEKLLRNPKLILI